MPAIQERTFSWPPGYDSAQAPNIIADLTDTFDGQVSFDLQDKLREDEAVTSAVASISPVGPTIGTIAYTGDRRTVHVPLTGFAPETTYQLTLTVTSTGGKPDTFDVIGEIQVP